MTTDDVIIDVSGVHKDFTTPDGQPFACLDDVNLQLREGEIVALLGKSGSGKSTLLRCIAGLIAPTVGTVSYRGMPLNGANPGVAMVFQSFALLPWLTVQANVELGLEARGTPTPERHARALKVIDLIGLDGFEQAYPKELSGGMRQRVGFARALVVEPDALLMDEPFSALDVLTAENLRTELLNLWNGPDFPTKAILLVTHNIEEAVLMADRIFVLSSNPGQLRAEIPDALPRPRDRRSPAFEALVDQIYGIMTGRESSAVARKPTTPGPLSPTELPLPTATVGGLAGLMEILANRGGRADLPELANFLTFEVDDLLPLVDAADLLGFAEVSDADLHPHARRQGVDRGEHPAVEGVVRRRGAGAGAAGAGDRARPRVDQGRHPQRALLPRPPRTRLHGRGRAGAARHRHRLGPLRRAVRLRR